VVVFEDLIKILNKKRDRIKVPNCTEPHAIPTTSSLAAADCIPLRKGRVYYKVILLITWWIFMEIILVKIQSY